LASAESVSQAGCARHCGAEADPVPTLGKFRRRAYDWRAALLLFLQKGVTEFATANEKDFRDCGFKRVWNPLASD